MPSAILSESGEIDKANALYFPAKYIGNKKGARCGDCMFFGDNDCQIVSGHIDENGVCCLYVHVQVSKDVAGYIDNGPTHCGNCKYFDDGDCAIVKGKVEFGGCCNFWEGK